MRLYVTGITIPCLTTKRDCPTGGDLAVSVCCCCCPGGVGIVLPLGPLLWLCGAVWVVEHIVAVLIVCAVCGLLALVVSIVLLVVGRPARRRQDGRVA